MNIERRKPSFRTMPPEPSENSPLLVANGANGVNAANNNNNNNGSSTNDNDAGFWGDDDSRLWVGKPKMAAHITWLVLCSNSVNVLLVFVPLGIVSGVLKWSAATVFALNFLAIVPLAALLSYATEQLSAAMGQTTAGLMNASFGNAVELIVSIVALVNGQIRLVQAQMLGSILSNILLVLGCCFIAGGIRGNQQNFNKTVANTMSPLLAVASTSLIIPAALSASLTSSKSSTRLAVLQLSRGTSIILLILYMLYLFFQLKTHSNFFDEERPTEASSENAAVAAPEERQVLNPFTGTITLILVTILVAICADYLVDSIDEVVKTTGISKTFIGIIMLPIVGNAAEHVTACIVAYKGKMDLAIGVAIGSSLQIAMFVTPFMVMLGWIISQDMTLHFRGFETVIFFISVQVVNYLIQDGESNYLEGALLVGTYIIIGIAFYMYPDDANDIGRFVKAFFEG